MKYLLSCGFFCLLMFLSYGQKGRFDPNSVSVVSPSPAALGKFTDYPVNLANGLPEINVPIFDIKSKELALPISLSYHAGGIKVDEESSFIGLGWSLNAGGVVTRIIRDKDDWGSYGFATRYSSIPDFNPISEEAVYPGGISNSSQLLDEYNNYDKEPDMYIVNVPGINATFTMNNEGNFVSIDDEPNSYFIDYQNRLIIVKDKLGNIYRFGRSLTGVGAFEESSVLISSNTNISKMPVVNVWHLTEIISASKSDTIRLSYKTLSIFTSPTTNVDRYTFIPEPGLGIIDARGNYHEGVSYSTISSTIANGRLVDKITFNNGAVQFITTNDRLDVRTNGDVNQRARISECLVLNIDGGLYKRIVFKNGDHFSRTGIGGSIIPPYTRLAPVEATKSLKINGVEFYDQENRFVYDYKFEYNPTPLPPRNSSSQDLWGYFNGKSVTEYIPYSFYINNFSALNEPIFVGSNREPDFNYIKASSLQKLTYPTGGYTEYEYEPNYYLSKEQQEGKSQSVKNLTAYAINRTSTCPPDFYGGAGASTVFEFTVTEDLGVNDEAVANFSMYFSDFLYTSNGASMRVKIYKVGSEDNSTRNYEHSASDMLNSKVLQESFLIQENCTYRVELNTNNVSGSSINPYNSPFIEFGVSYSYWQYSSPEFISPKIAGGMRIKEIRSYDAISNLQLKKIYEYGKVKFGSQLNIGVGQLVSNPYNNFYRYPELYATSPVHEELRYCLHFTSNSQSVLGYNYGSPLDYELVTEKTVSYLDLKDNGKTEYYYSRTGAVYEPMSSYKYPYLTLEYPTWQKSVLLRKLDYRYVDGGHYELKNSTENFYETFPKRFIKTLKVLDFQPDVWSRHYDQDGTLEQEFGNNSSRFFFYNYFVSTGRNRLDKKVETYYVNGQPVFTQEEVFDYNQNQDISYVKTKNSKGDVVETRMLYTGDLDYTVLKSNNIISSPVLFESRGNGLLRDGVIVQYNDDGQQIANYKLEVEKPVLSTSNYTQQSIIPVLYSKKQTTTYYPQTKRIREIKNENNYTTVYLWGYKNEYPVISIKNTDYSTIASILGSTQIDQLSNGTPSEFRIREVADLLRANTLLKNAEVLSYSFYPLVGPTSETNAAGLTSYFDFDPFGRLMHIYDKNHNVLKKYCYNYLGQPISCNDQPFYNSTTLSAAFQKSDCSEGYTSSPFLYTVPMGTVVSYISVSDANLKAQLKLQQEGQALANANGVCVPISTCDESICMSSGPQYRCVNGVCEVGFKVYTSSVYVGGVYECYYRYEWSDGYWADGYMEINSTDCSLSIIN